MLISVLINNHNYGCYIGEAIESVLNQCNCDFELIIVDGNSDDESRTIISEYGQKYPDIIKIVLREESGQAGSINIGYKVSKGEIITLLDSDDSFMPGKLEEIAALHKQYQFIGTASARTDGKDHDIVQADGVLLSKCLKEYGFIYNYELTTSCISFTRELAEKMLPMPEKGYETYADVFLKMMGQYYANIHFVNRKLSVYRIHDKNAMASVKNSEEMHNHIKRIYMSSIKDVNTRLALNGDFPIPFLSIEGHEKAINEVNPHVHIKRGASYAIYGTGLNGFKLLDWEKCLDISFVFAIDSNEEKQGTIWCDRAVISPIEAKKRRNEYEKILISASFYNEIKKTLDEYGFSEGMDYVGNLVLNDY